MAEEPRGSGQRDVGRSRRREERLIIGRLQEYGHAPYQFRSHETPSYFVRLLTDRGERVLWGKDLERAIARSVTQPELGEFVGARRVGREAVTIVARERDSDGRVIGQSEQVAHRNRWIVEKVQFFAERSKLAQRVRERHADVKQTVREHPELASTYLSLRGAQELAERRIADPKDRERFVALVRDAIAGSIHKGEPLPTVRLRDQPSATRPARSTTRAVDDKTR
jgi:putative DNA primase/helicase